MSRSGGITTVVLHEGRVVTAGVFGELDLYTAAGLGTVLAECLDLRPACLIVDVSAVSFCDSSGLSALLQAAEAAAHAGTDFVLEGQKAPTLLRLLAVTGLDAVFGIRQQHGPASRPGPAAP
ncbi:STAS domain-containing protein [Streptomyces sp. NPDC046759]|uniref:STAS domain-containing protein n=1 Tax=Streptomyces sp. NPDC046759 TaxID=3155019 RepID=UPI0033D9E3B5